MAHDLKTPLTSVIGYLSLLEQICFEFIPLFQEKDLVYRLDCEDGLELVCDVDKLQRVLDNLLKNVVNYSYEHTEVLVTAKRHLAEDRMEIRIRNHGRTIPEEKRKRIFEQFFRLESSRGTKNGGAGLGLAIAKEIVERHGGSLTCESENETITFVMVLPLGGMENQSTNKL